MHSNSLLPSNDPDLLYLLLRKFDTLTTFYNTRSQRTKIVNFVNPLVVEPFLIFTLTRFLKLMSC